MKVESNTLIFLSTHVLDRAMAGRLVHMDPITHIDDSRNHLRDPKHVNESDDNVLDLVLTKM